MRRIALSRTVVLILILTGVLFLLLIPTVPGQEDADGHITVQLDTSTIEIDRGMQTSYWITIENTGGITETVNIEFKGDYRNYAYVDRTSIPVGPGMKRQINMTIYALDDVEPGTYTLIITATSVETEVTGSYTVEVVVKEEASSFNSNWIFLIIPILLIPVIVGFITYKIINNMQKSFKVHEVFIVYNDGRLIRHFPESEDKEEDISISAMFTAIQEFIGDSFDYSEEGEGYLTELVFGQIKVFIERGPHFHIAIVAKGEPPKELRAKMTKIKEEIETRFEKELEEWDGDQEPFEDIQDITLDEELFMLLK
jgi:hypothetical protein